MREPIEKEIPNTKFYRLMIVIARGFIGGLCLTISCSIGEVRRIK
jgi:hypothetical protein